ncbi:hypothetical protein C6H68_05205 [Photorhabdus luminescens]|nr:hypothetical protein C6H68_05205 [Photorhabdus luminescens]
MRLMNRKRVHAYKETLRCAQHEVLRLMGLQTEQAQRIAEQRKSVNGIAEKKANLTTGYRKKLSNSGRMTIVLYKL